MKEKRHCYFIWMNDFVSTKSIYACLYIKFVVVSVGNNLNRGLTNIHDAETATRYRVRNFRANIFSLFINNSLDFLSLALDSRQFLAIQFKVFYLINFEMFYIGLRLLQK